jgi:Spy/CpxP family protein refolding chaperone
MWSSLLAVLVLQTPPQAVLAVGVGQGSGTTVGTAQGTPAPAAKAPGPSTQQGQGRGQSPDRSPNGQPRSGQTSGSGSSLIDDLDQRWPWWNDVEIKRQLGLSEATVQAIDDVVRERMRSSRSKYEEFGRETAKLNRMGPSVDEATFHLQVISVERLRSELATSRTMMNFRIAKLLQPDQLKKLREIREVLERRRADRNRSSDPGNGRQGNGRQ